MSTPSLQQKKKIDFVGPKAGSSFRSWIRNVQHSAALTLTLHLFSAVTM